MPTRDDLNAARMAVAESHMRYAVDAIEIQMDHDMHLHDDAACRDIAFGRYLLVIPVAGDEQLSVHDDLDVAHDVAHDVGIAHYRIVDLDTGRCHAAHASKDDRFTA